MLQRLCIKNGALLKSIKFTVKSIKFTVKTPAMPPRKSHQQQEQAWMKALGTMTQKRAALGSETAAEDLWDQLREALTSNNELEQQLAQKSLESCASGVKDHAVAAAKAKVKQETSTHHLMNKGVFTEET
ncbi:hypothetical protein CVT25_014413 [Psilocybe cyanescens]|uniref:Uncharacterized protein n=1 Tax=Psilocybe cyanescens TaxID=93625 RepID=A0A409XL33_PSICY|nr:hypothetical protein CVT25_014413 [Psilocybe cyanescens]